MVSAEADFAKGEMEKRRKIRLAQVRQQSDQIAAKVRKNVQKARKGQEINIEKKDNENFEQWKMQRLLELQEQYCESLKNLGLGHAQAIIEEAKDKMENEYKAAQMEKTKDRSRLAVKQLQLDLEEKMEMKKKDVNKKKLKTPLPRKKKRKKSESEDGHEVPSSDNEDIDIVVEDNRISNKSKSRSKSIKLRSESPRKLKSISPTRSISPKQSRSESPKQLRSKNPKSTKPEGQYEIDFAKSSRSKSPKLSRSESPKSLKSSGSARSKSPQQIRSKSPELIRSKSPEQIRSKSPEQIRSKSPEQIRPKSSRSESPKRFVNQSCSALRPPSPKISNVHHHVDTRISDRIKNRRLPPYRDPILVDRDIETVNKELEPKVLVSTGTLTEAEKECLCCCKCKCKSRTETEDLKSEKLKIHTINCNCCTCSDKIPSKPTVILKGKSDKVQFYDHKNRFSKEYLSSETVQKITDSEIEIVEDDFVETDDLMVQRRNAEIRGKKAMEKEKIQRDYKELMEKLPALQRQERIASLGMKSNFHLSESRSKQQEIKKQCKMEDAYEKLFPHTNTLKPKIKDDKQPFRVVENPDDGIFWDVEQNGVVITKDSGVITINPNVSDQTDNLKVMLDKLKKQKEMLLREVETLPRDSNLDTIIDDLEKFRSNDENHNTLHKRKHSTRDKRKSKIHKVILQNTSTQTSPKVEFEKLDDEEFKSGSTSKSSDSKICVCSSKSYNDKVCQCDSKVNRVDSKVRQVDSKVNHIESKVTHSESKRSQGDSKASESSLKLKHTESKAKQTKVRHSKTKRDSKGHVDSGDSKISLADSKTSKSSSKIIHKCKCCPACDNNGVCEIVIKIQDDVPEINIKSPKKPKIESITTNPSTSIQDVKKSSIKPKLYSETDSKMSWSKTFAQDPSTSTSYYSPPDFQRPRNENLLGYVKKLLTMSRKSIENLEVSDVSIDSSTNGTPNTAGLALRLLEANLLHMEKELNDSSMSNSKSDYTSSSSYENPIKSVEKYQMVADKCHERISNLASMIEKVRQEKELILSPNFSDKDTSTAYLNLPNSMDENKSNYSSSSEKEQEILNKLLLDVNTNLKKFQEQIEVESRSKSPDNKTVDPDLYQRFKNLMTVQHDEIAQIYADLESETQSIDTRMIGTRDVEIQNNLVRNVETRNAQTQDSQKSNQFVPMFNIPRLPKLRFAPEIEKHKKPPPAKGLSAAKKFNGDITNVPHELSTIAEVDSQLSTKASPQKSDSSPQKDNFKQQKIVSPQKIISPQKSISTRKSSISPVKSNLSPKKLNLSPQMSKLDTQKSTNSQKQIQQRSPSRIPFNQEIVHISEESMPDIVAELKASDSSERSSSDMENLEAMLASMGMGWAIATLRKTQKALLQTASTSTDEKNSSTSDITLRDYLGKRIFSTSSTFGSSSSMSPFIRELEEISVIQGSGVSVENRRHRTSTPVGVTNLSMDRRSRSSSDSSRLTDGAFVTIPEASLDKSDLN